MCCTTMKTFLAIFVALLHALSVVQSALVSSTTNRVLITGAGPAGLMTAHALLSRNDKYAVHILESKGDPRQSPIAPRAYSLGLNIRGQSVFKYFESLNRCKGLWSAIQKEGVESDSFFLHLGNQKLHLRKPAKSNVNRDPDAPPPTLLIQRNRLSAAMLSKLEKDYLKSGRFSIAFDAKLVDVSLQKRQAVLESGQIIDYDLLIGADGVQSCVRQAMIRDSENSDQSFVSEEVVLPGQFKVMVQSTPSLLEADAVHAMESGKKRKATFSLFSIPTIENRMCTLVTWRTFPSRNANSSTSNHISSAMPAFLREDASNEEVKSTIAEYFPQFGRPTDEAVAQLRNQRPSESRTIRCNRYHHRTGRALLLGDAAHSTGGTLGQGANSALLDVVAFDQCLDETQDNVELALTKFSERQVPQGLALWQLLQLPPKGFWGALYQVSQLLLNVLGKFRWLRKLLPRATQTYLSQTLLPFSEIVRRNRFWIQLATKRFRKIEYVPERS